MRLLFGNELGAALDRNEVICAESGRAANRLDDIRIGLSLDDSLITDIGDIDPTRLVPARFHRFRFEKTIIEPGRFYLGASRERIRIPPNVMGQMFTRSKYARVGLEFALSSSFVFPGYGWDDPKPFVFEISARAAPIELRAGNVYAFLTLFILDRSLLPKPTRDREFPFVQGGL